MRHVESSTKCQILQRSFGTKLAQQEEVRSLFWWPRLQQIIASVNCLRLLESLWNHNQGILIWQVRIV